MKKNDQTPPESKRKKAPAEKNAATKKPPQESRCLVAGIGASAGALESYKKFLSEMPLESGISFVLVQHLDPRHKTLMPELLAASTSMPIILVTEETRVEPNHVYLIPADTVLTISKGVLHPSAPLSGQMERNTIDHFFRSLAHDQEECGVGIILSGNGSDGTEGVKAIKERGGMTMTQNVELARYPGMPRSAIESGLIDHILPIAEMPARLIEYAKYINEIRHTKRNGGIHDEAADQLARICSILRRQTGHDFSQYKRSTLVRRIQHRIQVQHAESVTGYVDRLLNDPREVDQLFKDLLIGVTHFFRDTEAFESLAANVIPRIFEEKDGNGYVRVWVPGCSSGEEAYTIAILLSEYIAEHDPSLNAQIFATDIDDEALEIARQARYPVAIEEHVPQESI
jgi:two-component system CheB/CheR fusion protein